MWFFPENIDSHIFDNFLSWFLAKFGNCTLWPWHYEFSSKRFDICTLWIFDNCILWILDNSPLGVIWQFSLFPFFHRQKLSTYPCSFQTLIGFTSNNVQIMSLHKMYVNKCQHFQPDSYRSRQVIKILNSSFLKIFYAP